MDPWSNNLDDEKSAGTEGVSAINNWNYYDHMGWDANRIFAGDDATASSFGFLGNPKMAELQLGTIDNVSPCLFVFFFRSGFEFESRGTHKKNKYMMVSK